MSSHIGEPAVQQCPLRLACPTLGNVDEANDAENRTSAQKLNIKDETVHQVYDERSLHGIASHDVSDATCTGVVSFKWWESSAIYRHRGRLAFIFIYLVFTSWWIFGLVKHRELGWIVPFLIWLALTLRLFFFYVPSGKIVQIMGSIWHHTFKRLLMLVPEKLRIPGSGIGTAAIIIITALSPKDLQAEERIDRIISLIGLALCILVLWATSKQRALIMWQAVIAGVLGQFLIALFVLRSEAGFSIFHFISGLAEKLLKYAKLSGMAFLTSDSFVDGAGGSFYVVGVLPCIALFVAIVHLLTYLGTVQWVVAKAAVLFFHMMKISGAEAIVAAASPFLGQGESATLIKQLVPYLTKAEIHQIMCSGFATVSGSGLAGYIALGINPQPLVCSCVMSIPAAIAVSKLRYPETDISLTVGGVASLEDTEERPANLLHAVALGAWQGIKIAAIIGGNLLVIISLIGIANGLLAWWGKYWGINHLTLEQIVGYLFYPVAFFLGISRNGDLLKAGQLIGIKVIANEYVAYSDFQSEAAYLAMSPRSRLIMTFALCGFGNIGSLGVQIGVLSQISNKRVADISDVAMSALVTGIISTLSSASIAGLLLNDESAARFL